MFFRPLIQLYDMPMAKELYPSKKKNHTTQSLTKLEYHAIASLFSLAVTLVTYIMRYSPSDLCPDKNYTWWSGEPPADFTQQRARLSLYDLDERHQFSAPPQSRIERTRTSTMDQPASELSLNNDVNLCMTARVIEFTHAQ